MKTSIIYLGIALVTFTNVALATDYEQSFEEDNRSPQVQKNGTSEITKEKEGTTTKNYDFTSNVSNLPVLPAVEKTIEEVIAEDNLITERTLTSENNKWEEYTNSILVELQPFPAEKTMEQIIWEDSLIIERPLMNLSKQTIVGTSKEIQSLQ